MADHLPPVSPALPAACHTAPSRGLVTGFIAIAFLWAWSWWALTIALLRADPTAGWAAATMTLGTCAPAVAAWVCWQYDRGARGAWRSLRRCVVPAGPSSAWWLSTIAVVAVIGTASAVQRSSGAELPGPPSLWLLVPNLIMMRLVGGGQEEIGWRGWLQPMLRARMARWGHWGAPLLVGSLWFCWHLPLWLVPGSIQTSIPMPTFALMTIGMSLLMARCLEETRGRPAVALWLHAVNNLAATYLVFISPVVGSAQPGAWAMGAGYLVVGLIAMLLPQRPTGGGASRPQALVTTTATS